MQFVVDGVEVGAELSPGELHLAIPKRGYDNRSLDVIRQYARVTESEAGITLAYSMDARELSYVDALGATRTKLDRLQLAHKVVAGIAYRGSFQVPCVHPVNVTVNGEVVRVVHSGLQGVLVPREYNESEFLRSLQALALMPFHSRLSFEQLVAGAKGFRDTYSAEIRDTTTREELLQRIGEHLAAEQASIADTKALVSKRRYFWFRAAGVVGVLVGATAGVFAWQAESDNRLRSAVIDAQARFIATDYAGTMAALTDYASDELPSSARYVLAVSSINLDDLTAAQKQTVLNTISEKSDAVTLSFWIAIGRGDFDQALDYAQNLGDDQLTLLAYTDLHQATTLNTSMPGEKKQELLAKYAEAIDKLTAKLSGAEAAEPEAAE